MILGHRPSAHIPPQALQKSSPFPHPSPSLLWGRPLHPGGPFALSLPPCRESNCIITNTFFLMVVVSGLQGWGPQPIHYCKYHGDVGGGEVPDAWNREPDSTMDRVLGAGGGAWSRESHHSMGEGGKRNTSRKPGHELLTPWHGPPHTHLPLSPLLCGGLWITEKTPLRWWPGLRGWGPQPSHYHGHGEEWGGVGGNRNTWRKTRT